MRNKKIKEEPKWSSPSLFDGGLNNKKVFVNSLCAELLIRGKKRQTQRLPLPAEKNSASFTTLTFFGKIWRKYSPLWGQGPVLLLPQHSSPLLWIFFHCSFQSVMEISVSCTMKDIIETGNNFYLWEREYLKQEWVLKTCLFVRCAAESPGDVCQFLQ